MLVVVSRQVVPSVSIAVTLDQKLRVQIIPDKLEHFPKMYFKVWSQNKT